MKEVKRTKVGPTKHKPKVMTEEDTRGTVTGTENLSEHQSVTVGTVRDQRSLGTRGSNPRTPTHTGYPPRPFLSLVALTSPHKDGHTGTHRRRRTVVGSYSDSHSLRTGPYRRPRPTGPRTLLVPLGTLSTDLDSVPLLRAQPSLRSASSLPITTPPTLPPPTIITTHRK